MLAVAVIAQSFATIADQIDLTATVNADGRQRTNNVAENGHFHGIRKNVSTKGDFMARKRIRSNTKTLAIFSNKNFFDLLPFLL